jgi:hypothetical protein
MKTPLVPLAASLLLVIVTPFTPNQFGQGTATLARTPTRNGAQPKLIRLAGGPGLLTTGNLLLNSQTTIEMEVNGTVDLGGGLLNLSRKSHLVSEIKLK